MAVFNAAWQRMDGTLGAQAGKAGMLVSQTVADDDDRQPMSTC